MTDDSAAAEPSTAYDRMAYFGHAFDQTHPDRLATIASLHGMNPAPVPGCRVLEIGCADGGNLIPMACQWPESRFVGVDLSERAIDKAIATAAALGLRNVTLLRLDLMEIGADFGRFDYVIAHGVYSWVPPPVRARILEIFRQNLAPEGVAYVSYNAYPGCRLREIARDMMLFRVRGNDDPQTRVDQARLLLDAVCEASDKTELYGFLLHQQWDRIRKLPDSRLYHDDLEECARAFYLHEVAEEAAGHGLQYLADAASPLLDLESEPEPVRKLISQIPDDDAVGREQYLDFIKGRGFRTTLLCHKEARLQRRIEPHRIRACHIAACTTPADQGLDPGEAGIARFTTAEGGIFSTDHPPSKAALLHLGEVWPQAVGFAGLVERARAMLGEPAAPGAEVDALTVILFRLASRGTVALHLYPPRLTTRIGERPLASPYARMEAADGQLVTNLRHTGVWIEDEIVRRFLVLVDGTRTIGELVRDLEGTGVTRADVERNLATMARLGLLAA